MAYIGNIPAESYASFETETFSVSATTNYTLSHAVTNENEIRLVINGVVQQPGSGKAYTASGTTLTLTSATVSGDVMYAVYLGRALQTVNPPNASVGLSQLSATGTKSSSTFLRGDNTFASAGGDNTPAFMAVMGTNDTLANSTWTKATFDTEVFDTNSAFASNKFTVPTNEGGKYIFFGHILSYNINNTNRVEGRIYKNGSNVGGASTGSSTVRWYSGGANFQMDMGFTWIGNLTATDYIELYVMQTNGDSQTLYKDTWFAGYKLIGV